MTAIALPRKRVLADYVPAVAGVPASVGARSVTCPRRRRAGFIGLLAQWSIPLPGTPVPLTLGTSPSLLTGASLGWRARPAQRRHLPGGRWPRRQLVRRPHGRLGRRDVRLLSASSSPAALVGWLPSGAVTARSSRPRHDGAGQPGIYAVGVPWLMGSTGWTRGPPWTGVTPFLVGDAIKIAAAAGLSPPAGRWSSASSSADADRPRLHGIPTPHARRRDASAGTPATRL